MWRLLSQLESVFLIRTYKSIMGQQKYRLMYNHLSFIVLFRPYLRCYIGFVKN